MPLMSHAPAPKGIPVSESLAVPPTITSMLSNVPPIAASFPARPSIEPASDSVIARGVV